MKAKLGDLMLWLIIWFGFISSKCFAAVSKPSCVSIILSGQQIPLMKCCIRHKNCIRHCFLSYSPLILNVIVTGFSNLLNFPFCLGYIEVLGKGLGEVCFPQPFHAKVCCSPCPAHQELLSSPEHSAGPLGAELRSCKSVLGWDQQMEDMVLQ